MLTILMTTRRRKVVVSLDSFKGTVAAPAGSAAVAAGWRASRPDDDVVVLPMADGGEGTADVLASVTPGSVRHPVVVTGPDGVPARTSWLALPDGTAVVETATTCGYAMTGRSDPVGATSRGLGEALLAAVRHPATWRIVVALGGSATTDGGRGALEALGTTSPPVGGAHCLTDVTAPLLGALGAARQFSPQKGATPAQVELLEERLRRWADELGGQPEQPGAGAAGGIGYGLAAGWGAHLHPGAAYVAGRIGLPDQLVGADVVVTGEGRLDAQSLRGKVVGHVVEVARRRGVRPLIACGQAEPTTLAALHDHVAELATMAGSVEAAMADPLRWLTEAGSSLART
jgi:glycerate kinase